MHLHNLSRNLLRMRTDISASFLAMTSYACKLIMTFHFYTQNHQDLLRIKKN